jgi:hypothetical protein
VPNPIVTQVADEHGRAAGGLRYDVTQFGYEEREYFFEGTAKTYPPSGAPPATYRSRMVVWTPKDPSRFNGTTVVEWGHISVGGVELNATISVQSSMLVEQGFAFVLVTAHEEGVCGGGTDGCGSSSLRNLNPERYGSLMHPGEDYGFDIFNQALQAIKYPSGTAPLGELVTQFIIAEGFQPTGNRSVPIPDPGAGRPPYGSAGPLNGYITSPASEVDLADAFLLDSAGPVVEPEEYPGLVLHHLDETAIQRVPPPNRPNHITWEVTGAPHFDRWGADHILVSLAPGEPKPLLNREEEEAMRRSFDNYGQLPDPGATVCAPTRTLGTLYPRHYTLNAALVAVQKWLETGVPPTEPPPLERVGPPPASATEKLNRDNDGNAIGGLRSPIIQVPVATYDGEGCIFGGTSTQFSPERLAELYPTHQSYVEQLLAATNKAVDDRTLLCEDAQTIMRGASSSTIGGSDAFSASPDCSL